MTFLEFLQEMPCFPLLPQQQLLVALALKLGLSVSWRGHPQKSHPTLVKGAAHTWQHISSLETKRAYFPL